MPLSEEKVRLEKQPVVREEVNVSKREVADVERVNADVRREELRVDPDPELERDQRQAKNLPRTFAVMDRGKRYENNEWNERNYNQRTADSGDGSGGGIFACHCSWVRKRCHAVTERDCWCGSAVEPIE